MFAKDIKSLQNSYKSYLETTLRIFRHRKVKNISRDRINEKYKML
jgi:hypothetical protein